jgi:hypothetical protein
MDRIQNDIGSIGEFQENGSQTLEEKDPARADAAELRKSTPGKRKAGTDRVALHRARKSAAEAIDERRQLVLSEKQHQRQRENRAAAIAKTLNRLTGGQRAAIELNTEEFPGWRQLCDQMFEIIVLSDLELFAHCRPDFVAEFHQEFVNKHPYAKDLISPRAWFWDRDYRGWMAEYGDLFAIRDAQGKVLIPFDRDAPVEFSMEDFQKALERFNKWRVQQGLTTDVSIEPAPRRPRMRRLPPKPKAPSPSPVDAAKWTTPPSQPQQAHWRAVEADRAARALEKEVAETEHTKPPAF